MTEARVKSSTAKAEETRERILESALALFRSNGFDKTTMRDVAVEAGVATGAAYYYFRSKEELIMAFYARMAAEARADTAAILSRSTDLKKRLRALIDYRFEQFGPNRQLFIALLRTGIDPDHPLSPFGSETAHLREEHVEIFNEALAGSNARVPKDLGPFLPRLLWMYQMGLMLFWMYDKSPGQEKTGRLVDGSLDLVVQLIRMASLPLIGPLRSKVVKLLRIIE